MNDIINSTISRMNIVYDRVNYFRKVFCISESLLFFSDTLIDSIISLIVVSFYCFFCLVCVIILFAVFQ